MRIGRSTLAQDSAMAIAPWDDELSPCVGPAMETRRVGATLDGDLDAFLLSREAMRCTAKTLEFYAYTLEGFVDYLVREGVRGVEEVTAAHIRAFLVSLQRRGLKDTTQHAHARAIKTWLGWLVAEGRLPRSPMARVAMPRLEQRVPAPFSAEEVQRLLAHCDRSTPQGSRNYAMALTLLDSGLRLAEVCGLRVGAIDPDSGLVAVLGKGAKQRFVRVGSGAREAIEAMMALRQAPAAPGEPVWVTAKGRDMTPHGVQTMLVRLGALAGVRPCAPHRFRRTFALWCLRDGMDLESLRHIMGHSSLAVLERYLALDVGDVARAHRAHSPVDKLLWRGAEDEAEPVAGPWPAGRARARAHAQAGGRHGTVSRAPGSPAYAVGGG